MDNGRTELLDDLMTQLSHSQVELVMSTNIQHYNEAKNIVKNHVVAGIGMGLIPIVLFDIAALSTNQQLMLRNLCRHYNVDYDSHRGKLLISSLLSGSMPVLMIMGLASISKLVPGIGTLGGSGSVALLGGALTYATGQTFIKHFSEKGSLADFMPEQFSDFFNDELKKGKEFTKEIKTDVSA